MKVNWIVQRGYSIESQLHLDGLSFAAFDLIQASTDEKTTQKIRGKIISKLAKELRSDCMGDEGEGPDIAKIKYGTYCIAVGTGFEIDYTQRTSRIVYIGSGAVYERIKSHLKDKLFEFASVLRSIPLRFYIADLSYVENPSRAQRELEQALLQKFSQEIDAEFPLLNARNAKTSDGRLGFEKGWDYPLQKERGRNSTSWLLKPQNQGDWKGSL